MSQCQVVAMSSHQSAIYKFWSVLWNDTRATGLLITFARTFFSLNHSCGILHRPFKFPYRTSGHLSQKHSQAELSRVYDVRRSSAKHETSTIRKSHIFISIDLKFGLRDNVREVISPAKVGSGPMSARDATWRKRMRLLWLNFLYSSTELHHIPMNRISRTNSQKTRSGARKTLFEREMYSCENWGCLPLELS